MAKKRRRRVESDAAVEPAPAPKKKRRKRTPAPIAVRHVPEARMTTIIVQLASSKCTYARMLQELDGLARTDEAYNRDILAVIGEDLRNIEKQSRKLIQQMADKARSLYPSIIFPAIAEYNE